MNPLTRDYITNEILTEQESHHISHPLRETLKKNTHKINSGLTQFA